MERYQCKLGNEGTEEKENQGEKEGEREKMKKRTEWFFPYPCRNRVIAPKGG